MKKVVYTKKAPDPVGPYNQAIFSNNTLYISGQVALDPENGKMINKSLDDETNQVMNNLKAILKEVGFDFNNVQDCITKLYEEIDEYKEAISSDDEHKLLDEGGDLLFSAINILRKSGINSEEALNYANKKFMKRYLQAEKIAFNDGLKFNNLNLEQKHEYWLKSKKLLD